ncbi:MAG: DMT family transporter, partial [Actinomycetota bacterium]|nr:DMT family transporter [Actinomycetota bacterium]
AHLLGAGHGSGFARPSDAPHTGAVDQARTNGGRRADLALAGAALCFGGTFIVVQDAVEDVEPVPFLAVRFCIGAVLLWAVGRRRPATPGELRDGTAAGVALLAGYVFQTVGLQYTDSATSAFLTYLLVVFVPVIGFAVHRRRPHPATLAGIAVAVVGLVLLTDPGGGSGGFGRGEVLTLGCALAFAVHVIVLGATSHRHDPVRLTAIQITVVGLACLGPGAVQGGYRFPASAVLAAVATALIATALAFFLQVYGQRTVPPARAALLLLLEPVFAAVLAGITDDPLSAVQYLGGVTILGAVVLCELLDQRVDAREADLR